MRYIVVEFEEQDGGIYSMAIKTTHYPTVDELKEFLKNDMRNLGYNVIYDYYEVDEKEVYIGYDTDNIDCWPILGN